MKNWPQIIFDALISWDVSILTYIPDAGNAALVKLAETQNSMQTVLLTTEEEGVGICAGADLVGKRGVLCMQSSGVGNCPNFMSLVKAGRFPIFLIISMRGDYGEQNPWQYPMGSAVKPILDTMGISTFYINDEDDLENTANAALATSFKGGQAAALILTQKFLGAKNF